MRIITIMLMCLAVAVPTSALSEGLSLEGIDQKVRMTNKGRSTFYVATEILGFGSVEMLVDTGSSYLTIDNEALALLLDEGRAAYVRELTGVLADGSRKIVPIYRLDALRVGKHCWFEDVEAAVFPSGTRFILGLNVLRKASSFQFAFDPPQLTLGSCATVRS